MTNEERHRFIQGNGYDPVTLRNTTMADVAKSMDHVIRAMDLPFRPDIRDSREFTNSAYALIQSSRKRWRAR